MNGVVTPLLPSGLLSFRAPGDIVDPICDKNKICNSGVTLIHFQYYLLTSILC